MTDDFIGKVIDVDYKILSSDNDENAPEKQDTDITINADPISALISGFCGVVNGLTDAVKEYNICKQQEQTKRAEIKAQMKVAIEQINMQKEICLKVLDEQHEKDMIHIQEFYQQCRMVLEKASSAVQIALEIAKESKNFSDVCTLLEIENNIFKNISETELKFMETSSRMQLQGPKPKALLNLYDT